MVVRLPLVLTVQAFAALRAAAEATTGADGKVAGAAGGAERGGAVPSVAPLPPPRVLPFAPDPFASDPSGVVVPAAVIAAFAGGAKVGTCEFKLFIRSSLLFYLSCVSPLVAPR